MPCCHVQIDRAAARRAGVLALAALACAPVVAAAAPRHRAVSARSSITIALGDVYGGVTPQRWPVVVEVDARSRKVVRAVAGLRLECTSGDVLRASDGWEGLTIRRGKFRAVFGPENETLDDGTVETDEGAITGRFNRSRTKVSGTWSLKATFHDAAGAITDTCDSGVVAWSARN